MIILAIDVGGSHVKLLTNDATEPRRFDSGLQMTPDRMVQGVRQLADGWKYDVVTIGYPGAVQNNQIVAEPHNLAPGWVGFDFHAALSCEVKILNDAAMQALGDYNGGKMLFLGFGTGLGTAMIVDGALIPMELGHLPYKKGTFEDYVADRRRVSHGKKRWQKHVADVTGRLVAALLPNDVVLGGGNAKLLSPPPPGCRIAANTNAFIGGFRIWDATK